MVVAAVGMPKFRLAAQSNKTSQQPLKLCSGTSRDRRLSGSTSLNPDVLGVIKTNSETPEHSRLN